MSYRYYLTQRPPMPGAFPNTPGNKALRVHENAKREPQLVFKPVVIRAYGYVEYSYVLSSKDVESYELTPGKAECTGCKYADDDKAERAPCKYCSRFPFNVLTDFYEEK